MDALTEAVERKGERMTISINIPDERYKWIKDHKGVTDYSTTQMLYSRAEMEADHA